MEYIKSTAESVNERNPCLDVLLSQSVHGKRNGSNESREIATVKRVNTEGLSHFFLFSFYSISTRTFAKAIWNWIFVKIGMFTLINPNNGLSGVLGLLVILLTSKYRLSLPAGMDSYFLSHKFRKFMQVTADCRCYSLSECNFMSLYSICSTVTWE